MQGDSYPENSFEFFTTVISWIEDFLTQKTEPLTLELGLIYMNTSSVKAMMDIFDLLEEAHNKGRTVRVDWRYDPQNERVRELAEEFGLHLPPERLEAAFTFPNPRWAGRYSVFFTGQITQAEIAAIRFGGEGQGWRMMPLAEYLIHPKAVPHFPAQFAHCLGLPSP